MKRFSLGLLSGLVAGLILATTTFSLAADQIKLIVNGKEIVSDVPPQVINGRTLVPARALAEALGATVGWDAAKNAVVVTSQVQVGGTPGDLPVVKTTPQETSADNGLISLRELSSKGFELSSGKTYTVILKKNNAQILVPQPPPWGSYTGQTVDGDVVIDGQKTGTIKLKFTDLGTFINISDLKSLGLIQ